MTNIDNLRKQLCFKTKDPYFIVFRKYRIMKKTSESSTGQEQEKIFHIFECLKFNHHVIECSNTAEQFVRSFLRNTFQLDLNYLKSRLCSILQVLKIIIAKVTLSHSLISFLFLVFVKRSIALQGMFLSEIIFMTFVNHVYIKQIFT